MTLQDMSKSEKLKVFDSASSLLRDQIRQETDKMAALLTVFSRDPSRAHLSDLRQVMDLHDRLLFAYHFLDPDYVDLKYNSLIEKYTSLYISWYESRMNETDRKDPAKGRKRKLELDQVSGLADGSAAFVGSCGGCQVTVR